MLGVEAVAKLVIAAHDEGNVVQQVDHQRRAGDRQEKNRLLAAVDHAMARVERNREQAPLLPFEMHLALLLASGPDLGGTDALKDVDQFLVEMILRVKRAAGRNLTDVHAGETFHPFQIDVRAFTSGALPRFERQLGYVLDAVAFENGNAFFLEPYFVTRFSLRHD